MVYFILAVLLSACTPKVPKEYIQPDDMEDILYDYFVSQGMVKDGGLGFSGGDMDYKRELYFETVLKKYDSMHFAVGEGKQILNKTNYITTMLVIASPLPKKD